MDILSYAIASKQSRRIKKFIANPDSNSGVITVPKTIELGQTITIPYGRVAILPDINIEGEIIIEGEVFIPSGGSYNQVDMICDNIKSKDKTYTVITKNLVDTVKDQDITGKKNFINGLTTQGENITPYTGFKNLLVNGDFIVWNSGTSFTNVTDILVADRWLYHCATGGNVIKDNVSGNLGKTVPLRMTKTVSTPYQFIAQPIPSFAFLSGKTVTISCKVYCTNGLTKVGFGMTGNPSKDSATVTMTPSWNTTEVFNIGSDTLKTISKTITLPTFANDEYTFSVGIYIGDNYTTELGTVYIREVQMEIGDKATPFEHRPYDLELALCGEPNMATAMRYIPFNQAYQKGFKNLIINGCLSVWQRGTSWISANGPYMADRWFIDVNGAGTCSGYYYADDWIEGKYKVKTMAVTSGTLGSNPYIGFVTVLEDMMRFAGKTLTLSFWAASDSTDPIYVFFGRNYSTGVTYSGSIAAGAGNPVLKKYTVTYKVPNYSSETYVSNNSYLQITIRQGRTIPGILRVGQIQLEEGSIATSFEQRPYPLELAMCQRYYEAYANGSVAIRSGNYASNYINSTMIQFKVPKRTTPTVAIGTISLYSIGSGLQSGFTFSPIVNGNLDFYITCNKVSHGLTDMVITAALSYTVSAEFN